VPEYLLPDVGEGLTEAEIVTWKVKVGDVVAVNDIVVEIETAKSLVELPSPYAGTVTALMVPEGETVPVGTPIIAIGEPVAAAGPPADEPEIDLSNPAASGGGEGESLVGRSKADRGPTRRPRRKPITEAAGEFAARADVHDTFNQNATQQHEKVERMVSAVVTDSERQGAAVGAPEARSTAVPASAPAAEPAGNGDVRVLAKPPVRKLAKDLGIDLREVIPSRPDGVITREDVQAYGNGPPAEPALAPAPVTGERREPIRGVRRATAAAMVASAFTAPHVTEFLAVDVTETMALRDRLRATREYAEVRLTPLGFVAKAVCLAARRTPEVNAHWDEAAGDIVYYDRVQLGIAAATPRGLLVPKIRNADTLSLAQLATALGELTATAREGKTLPADLIGGTFTITNVGVFGVDTGTPILNPGEAAILAVGSIKQAPWVVDGELAVRTVCQLALSFDHRLVDGEQGSRFLADVGQLLEDPGLALTY
jgi:pyruvate dehydrogenase E2 component (dihydrolipoamide acetyltransferase)